MSEWRLPGPATQVLDLLAIKYGGERVVMGPKMDALCNDIAAMIEQAHDAALAEAADRLEADILALWTHARRNGFAASSIWVNRHEVLRLIAALRRSGGAG